MSTKLFAGCLALVLCAGLAGASDKESSITGQYLESRSCDVWTGPCFSNAEYNVVGDLAVVAWIVGKGSWDGVRLDGRRVAAVLDADGTFMTNVEGSVKAGVYIDREATEAQAAALLSMARAMAPRYLKDVVKIERRDIDFARRGAEARLVVGAGEARIETGMLGHCDTVCGNESQAYAPFSASVDVRCAKALEHSYRGTVIEGQSWSYPNKRSAMVGTFAR
jgi:hypothetical protein